MIVVDLDLSAIEQVAEKVLLVSAAIKEEVPNQLLFIQSTWIAAVSGHQLPGMARPLSDPRYAAMIAAPSALDYPFNGDDFSGRVIMTDGALAGRIEHGFASFDMKPGLLSGPNAKVSANGTRYNTIPFVHSTPGSQGQKGAPMPDDIYARAKTLGAGQRLKGLDGYGQRSKVPFTVNIQATARKVAGPMKSPYTWKTSPYEGMVRIKKGKHTTYMTFRTVSDHSDPNSWIHPGVAPNPVVRSVAEYVAPFVREAFEKIVADYLKM